jgi:RNA polymerase primary sigma factor
MGGLGEKGAVSQEEIAGGLIMALAHQQTSGTSPLISNVEEPVPSPMARVIVPQARRPLDSVCNHIPDEDCARLDRILSDQLEFIDHPSFCSPKTAQELFGSAGSEFGPRAWCNSAHVRTTSDQAAPASGTLSNSQEQRLFLRLNYARYRMAQIFKAFVNKRLTLKAVQELLFWDSRINSTRGEIVQANVPLVLAMAKRTRMGNIDYAELISEGNMALLRSVDKFDCGRGFKFSTYACRAILKSFSRVAMKASRYRGRFPTEFDPSLERSDYSDTQREGVELDCVDELRGILTQNSADLNDVEVRVIQARFALVRPAGEAATEAPKTLEQVGLMIGVTKERVRQIQNRALAKLRHKLLDDFLAA